MPPEFTSLTKAQSNRLDRLSEERPDARVVGWHDDGPLISDAGRIVRLNPRGRLTKPPAAVRKAAA